MEADLQAFLYGKISSYLESNNIKKYFEDKESDNHIKIYIVHCEYPRHVYKENKDGLLCNAGRHDIVILRKPKDKNEWVYVGKKDVNKYPVEVAFELKLIFGENLDKVKKIIEYDMRAFGWDDEKELFDPIYERKNKKLIRKYPKFGVVFFVNLIEDKIEEDLNLKEKLQYILNKKRDYKGEAQIPEKIFIVYIEIDRYNKAITNSFIIKG